MLWALYPGLSWADELGGLSQPFCGSIPGLSGWLGQEAAPVLQELLQGGESPLLPSQGGLSAPRACSVRHKGLGLLHLHLQVCTRSPGNVQ